MIKLTDKQKEAMLLLANDSYINYLLVGGKRAGKTTVILRYIILCCVKYKGFRGLIVRKRLTDAIGSIWIQSLLPMLEQDFKGAYTLDKSNHIVNIGESAIWIAGMDNKERSEMIFGQEYSLIFCNESVQLNRHENDRLESILSKKAERIQDGKIYTNAMLYDTNPSVRTNWLYKCFYKSERKGDVKLNFSPYDNRKNLPNGYIEQRLETLTGAEKERYLDGSWVSLEGAIYNHIKDENIIDIDVIRMNFDDFVAGADFGYFTAFDLFGVKIDGKKLSFYLLKEISLIDKTTNDLIKEIKALRIKGLNDMGFKIYCDHELDRIKEMCDNGLNAVNAYKEKGAGYSSVRRAELYFQEGQTKTFECLQSLMRQQDRNGDYIDDQVKIDDHEADATRYAIHGWVRDNHYVEDYNEYSDKIVTTENNWLDDLDI